MTLLIVTIVIFLYVKLRYKNKIILLSVIDNLIKGGAGQAVQNLNIKYNFRYNEV